MLSVLVIDSDVRTRNFLGALLAKLGHEMESTALAKEGYISSLRNRPNILIFDPHVQDMPSVELIQKLRADKRTAQVYCIALAARQDDALRSQLLAAGCNEYLLKTADTAQNLGNLINQVAGMSEERTQAKNQGGLLSVFLSAKGGTGTSSLCANLSQSIANQQTGMRMAVMDLVLPIGSIAAITGSQTKHNIVSVASESTQTPSASEISNLMVRPENWNFHLLAGSPDPELANNLDPRKIPELIRSVRLAFDYTAIDLGRSLSRISLPIIQEADAVVVVVSADLNTVEMTKTILDYLQLKGLQVQRTYIIMNRAVGLEGLSKSDVERIIGLQVQATIPYMGGNFTLANNQHLPVLKKFPNDTAALMVDQAARQILEIARQSRAMQT